MIGQTNQNVGGNAETRNFATAANQAAPADHDGRAERGPSQLNPVATTTRAPKTSRPIADARALEAHAARRQRLAAQVRVENPSRTEEEIEARLEQFGA